jgi:elongation factor Tu
MSFARTFLQTARAVRAGHSINPVQQALSARSQAQFVHAARCYATAFERTKPHVNIGTIGHVDHGKVGYTGTRDGLWQRS